ncbi:hypothetical protein HY450_04060 [Candidatus Pacearchaeota archaeon]|nr:hypothetical protein [Candidatus Pacearchaeota archaeon]
MKLNQVRSIMNKYKTAWEKQDSDNAAGFAEGECRNVHKGKHHKIVGIIIIKMKGDKISYLNEYWNTKIN